MPKPIDRQLADAMRDAFESYSDDPFGAIRASIRSLSVELAALVTMLTTHHELDFKEYEKMVTQYGAKLDQIEARVQEEIKGDREEG